MSQTSFFRVNKHDKSENRISLLLIIVYIGFILNHNNDFES